MTLRKLVLALTACLGMVSAGMAALQMPLLGTYQTGIFDESASEISAYDPATQRLFVVNVASQGNTADGHHYGFTDQHLTNGQTYNYSLFAVALDGSREEVGSINATPNTNANAPLDYALSAAYPNPFNPSTSFSYTLPEAANVTLQVFDINGRVVATLVNGNQATGEHRVSFDGKNLSSGIYYARMTANSFSAVQKLVLMK